MKAFINARHFNKMQGPKLKTKQDVFEYLNSRSIAFKEYTHKAALNMEDLKADPGQLDNSPFSKNLIYKDKKKNFYFVVVHEDTKLGASFWKRIGTTKNNVRFVKEDVLTDILNTYKGAVNAFSLINDTERVFKTVYFDQLLEKNEYINFHPQDNTSTIELKKEDMLKLLTDIGLETTFVDCSETPVEEKKKEKPAKKEKKEKKKDVKGETKLKIGAKKTENFSDWYSQAITKAEMVDYYDISGCYILRPSSYFIWEQIQQYLDNEFKKLGVKNVYFPMFVSKRNLEKEEDHVEGFAPEVAWVTHSGKSKLNEPIAIRPTSETIMYPTYKNWIHSYRDLPLLCNQWTNIVRWEFKHPTPFIRTREFLWQEGHTAHATYEEATEFTLNILDIYAKTYADLLAVPVIKGRKSEKEKFAGADFTTTCETFVQENGRAIQACTSHQLGQNFAKMFGINYLDKNMESQLVTQTSWGFTTRSIGVIIMIHGDDKGLVLPPKVAMTQVIFTPIYFKNKNNSELNEKCEQVQTELAKIGIRSDIDTRENQTAGFKFNDWELKGVPLRVELGPKDLEKGEAKLVRRVDNVKKQVSLDSLAQAIVEELEDIHKTMLDNATAKLNTNIEKATNWEDFMVHLNKLKIVMAPWCDEQECEEEVKERSGEESKNFQDEKTSLSGSAKTLCKPFKQDELPEGTKCFHCSRSAKTWVLWGRSY